MFSKVRTVNEFVLKIICWSDNQIVRPIFFPLRRNHGFSKSKRPIWPIWKPLILRRCFVKPQKKRKKWLSQNNVSHGYLKVRKRIYFQFTDNEIDEIAWSRSRWWNWPLTMNWIFVFHTNIGCLVRRNATAGRDPGAKEIRRFLGLHWPQFKSLRKNVQNVTSGEERCLIVVRASVLRIL